MNARLGGGHEIHYASGGHVLEKLRADPSRITHEVPMPVPVEGGSGPSMARSLANVLLPAYGRPPLVRQIADSMRAERRILDSERFDVVVSDGDMGVNVLAKNRGITCLFVTNQFRPELHGARTALYPAREFISRQIAKASRILVADSPPPYTVCARNLNFTKEAAGKADYVGCFAAGDPPPAEKTDLERLIEGADYGYWMRTGDAATSRATWQTYREAFAASGDRRVVSHAGAGQDSVTGRDGRTYDISEALERRVDWVQVDAGFLSASQMRSVVDGCRYAVVNGSHTAMCEILGRGRPVVGIPVYDEHENNIRWAEENGLGALAGTAGEAARAIEAIRHDHGRYEGALGWFQEGFDPGGAAAAARLVEGKG
ncbi:MAG: glycosyltransferase [Nitrosopumilus sp.]|nr:glycosyltransferase [Nitrosopumilus sp.]MDA7942557.1 glycosyltransferase [Nitrosopumilus sp.]